MGVYSLAPSAPLGYLSKTRTSETPGALRRCYRFFGPGSLMSQHVHGLDECPAPETAGEQVLPDAGILGYVR